MRARSRELTVVDLSVPRNVDPQVARTTGVTVVEMAALGDAAALLRLADKFRLTTDSAATA